MPLFFLKLVAIFKSCVELSNSKPEKEDYGDNNSEYACAEVLIFS